MPASRRRSASIVGSTIIASTMKTSSPFSTAVPPGRSPRVSCAAGGSGSVDTGVGSQLLRLCDVGGEFVRLRPSDLRGGFSQRAVHRLGKTEQHRVHDLLIGDRESDRLPHLEIIERRRLHVHPDILDAVAERRRDDRKLAELLQLGKILVWQVVGDIGVAALQQCPAVA